MALFGRHEELSAADALRADFVQRVTPSDRLLDTALADAATIARNSPAAVERMLRTLWAAQSMTLSDALALADSVQADWREHPDAHEGPRALAERREPRWSDT
jgi:crotonobetainyl-CoA hydratase